MVPILIEAEGITKRYGDRTVLDIERLSLGQGTILAVLGPSGAGKSVLMRILNLLEPPTTGQIRFKGDEVLGLKGNPRVEVAREMAMVFQDPLLFSTTVFKNVRYGLKVRGLDGQEAERKVMRALELVGMKEFAANRVDSLSGGEAQRVALARALVIEPSVLFLDEPFANLDPLIKRSLHQDVKEIIKGLDIGAVFVSHDQEEAAFMGDRILLINGGRLVQEGEIKEIFFRPKSRFAAHFVGMENVLEGVVVSAESGVTEVRVSDKILQSVDYRSPGSEVAACLRPEDVTVFINGGRRRTSARNVFRGKVTDLQERGPVAKFTVNCPFPLKVLVTARSVEEMGLKVGSEVGVSFKATNVHLI